MTVNTAVNDTNARLLSDSHSFIRRLSFTDQFACLAQRHVTEDLA